MNNRTPKSKKMTMAAAAGVRVVEVGEATEGEAVVVVVEAAEGVAVVVKSEKTAIKSRGKSKKMR
jgi:hypothetical protein